MWWLAGFACSGSQAGRIHAAPVSETVGDGWAVGVPEGARVTVDPRILRVDSADGTMWFDVRWTTEPANEITAHTWARATCTPPMWDDPWVTDGRWAAGGLCMIANHRWWMIHVLERVGDRTLHTAFLADSRWVVYEDAWVLATRTALSFAGGEHAHAPPDADGLRVQIRLAGAEPPGMMPIPGGGKLSTRIFPHLSDLWAARDRAPPPDPLSPR